MGLIWEEFNKEKVCTIRKYSINKKMDNYNKHNYKSEILYVVSKIWPEIVTSTLKSKNYSNKYINIASKDHKIYLKIS